MILAAFSESPADQDAIRILAEATLGIETSAPERRYEARGWPAVRNALPGVILDLHYQTDADGLVVVVDSDDSVVHTSAHDALAGGEPACRLCELRAVVQRTRGKLKALSHRADLKVAIGIAVPAVEAWYAWGTIPHVIEAAWTRKLRGDQIPYDKRSLKV
ncbi:MAG TPA: hypothetical protein VE913_24180 [Longimicrobium sp.]|nr:hypothetical protein [Longimicrobium sp.]